MHPDPSASRIQVLRRENLHQHSKETNEDTIHGQPIKKVNQMDKIVKIPGNDPVLSPIHTNGSNSIMEKLPTETEPLKAQKVENNDTENS